MIPAIDFGAAFSRIACLDETGKPQLIANTEGQFATPTTVWIRNGEPIVGEAAVRQWRLDDRHVAWRFKRALGDPEYRFLGLSAVELAAEVIKALKSDVECFLDRSISQAVVTAPARFGIKALDALREAAQLAGLRPLEILPEPMADMVYLDRGRHDVSQIRTFLMCNLGAGPAEVASIRRGSFVLEAARGDSSLDGDAWNRELAQLVNEKVQQQSGQRLFEDPQAARHVYEACEHAKYLLGIDDRTRIVVPLQGTLWDVEVTRAEFEHRTEFLVQELVALVQDLAHDSSLGQGRRDVEMIVLNGGSSRLRRVSVALKEVSGNHCKFIVQQPGATALGAAIVAGEHDSRNRPLTRRTPIRGPLTNSAPNVHPPCQEQRSEDVAEPTPSVWDENVQFTVFRPKSIVPQRWYPLLAFAHLSELPPNSGADELDPVEEVRRQAREILGSQAGAFSQLTNDSTQAIPRTGEITMVPVVPGIEFNPPQASFLWLESVHRQEFRLRAPSALDGKVVKGRMTVFWGALIVAEVALTIDVGGRQPAANALRLESAQARPYRNIFASYSHKDLPIVEQVEEHARAVGDHYVRDWQDLRAGEVWNDRLKELIAEADIFQLFWSHASMRSDFVRQEWRFALSLGRLNFIRPTYWDEEIPSDPTEDLPPESLLRLHFQRIRVSRRGPDDPGPGDGGGDPPDPRPSGSDSVGTAYKRTTLRNLGIRVGTDQENSQRNLNLAIIPRGTELPATGTQDFGLALDGQKSIEIEVIEFDDDARFELLGVYQAELPAGLHVGDLFRLYLRQELDRTLSVELDIAKKGLRISMARILLPAERSSVRANASSAACWIVYAVDVSASMAGANFEAMRRAVLDSAKGFLSLKGTRIALVAFGTEAVIQRELTENAGALEESLACLTLSGSTAMHAGIGLAGALFDHAPADVNRFVVVITDGIPDDRVATQEAVRQLQDQGVTVVVIGIGDRDLDSEFLRSLTPHTSIVERADGLGEALNDAFAKST